MSDRPCCLVIDGQPLVRLGVRGLLSEEFVVEEAATCEEALQLVRGVDDVDVAIVDMRPRANGAEPSMCPRDAIRALRRTEPRLGIVAHGERPERHLASAAIGAGANAYISRGAQAEHLRAAVRAALEQRGFEDPLMPSRGSRGRLTRRQREILQLLANGESGTIAARDLGLSQETVKTHMKHILARLEARNRTEAVAIGLRQSLIE